MFGTPRITGGKMHKKPSGYQVFTIVCLIIIYGFLAVWLIGIWISQLNGGITYG